MNFEFILFISLSILIGLIVFPLISYKTPIPRTSYLKANLVRRFLAATIDLALCFSVYPLFLVIDSAYVFIGSGVYALFRDSFFSGKSVGKVLMGLMVVSITDNRPCTPLRSVLRNMPLVIPGLNVIGIAYELSLIVKDQRGIRLGDRIAKTQVVEGKEIRELTKFVQMFLAYYDSLIISERPEKE